MDETNNPSATTNTKPQGEWFFLRWRREKREWREHVRRTKALPADYRTVFTLIEKYLWNLAAGAEMIPVLDGLLELFEEGAASGRPVLDVTGDDVAAFVWNVLTEVQSATWTGKKGAQLNTQVHAALRQGASGRVGPGTASPSDAPPDGAAPHHTTHPAAPNHGAPDVR
jgi:DNA-binding ferritin-like protein (Dps family)